MSSRLLFSAVQRVSNDFSILREARREVLEDLMDIQSAKKVVQWIDEKKLEVVFREVELPSPFAFNLYTQGYADSVKIEGKIAFIKRMHEQVLARLGEGKKSALDSAELLDLSTSEYSKPKTAKEIKLLDLKVLAWNLPHVPNNAKEELIALIDGKEELDAHFVQGVKKYSKEIKKTWPKELQKIVFEKIKESEKANA